MDTLSEVTNEVAKKQRTPTQEVIRHLFSHSSGRAGAIILGILILVAIFAPWIAPYDPTQLLKDQKRRDTPCIHILGCVLILTAAYLVSRNGTGDQSLKTDNQPVL